ncbi:YaaR family protein [Caminicella sporogenes]|uniref:YaaR family protein n=1 Tax=Caminicella sporogenes TaxID=166485 RepID=UPI00253FDC37|nr:YaaR family protein [Caminicella sporogenes]WIF94859.1 YaaR family protein [Caminicella sporogenes]
MPLKISDINNKNRFNSIVTKENTKIAKNTNNNFSLTFNKLYGDSIQEKLQNLLTQIDSQASKIEKKFELNEVLKYKKLVKEFLNIAVNNSHKFSKESFLDRRGRHRVMSLIKKVDNELEDLTKKFLQKEKSNLSILKKLDEIRGLLIDIFM